MNGKKARAIRKFVGVDTHADRKYVKRGGTVEAKGARKRYKMAKKDYKAGELNV